MLVNLTELARLDPTIDIRDRPDDQAFVED